MLAVWWGSDEGLGCGYFGAGVTLVSYVEVRELESGICRGPNVGEN